MMNYNIILKKNIPAYVKVDYNNYTYNIVPLVLNLMDYLVDDDSKRQKYKEPVYKHMESQANLINTNTIYANLIHYNSNLSQYIGLTPSMHFPLPLHIIDKGTKSINTLKDIQNQYSIQTNRDLIDIITMMHIISFNPSAYIFRIADFLGAYKDKSARAVVGFMKLINSSIDIIGYAHSYFTNTIMKTILSKVRDEDTHDYITSTYNNITSEKDIKDLIKYLELNRDDIDRFLMELGLSTLAVGSTIFEYLSDNEVAIDHILKYPVTLFIKPHAFLIDDIINTFYTIDQSNEETNYILNNSWLTVNELCDLYVIISNLYALYTDLTRHSLDDLSHHCCLKKKYYNLMEKYILPTKKITGNIIDSEIFNEYKEKLLNKGLVSVEYALEHI